MTADEQIIGVLTVVQHERMVNPEGQPFLLSLEKLEAYPDHQAILKKLETQYNVATIKRHPNQKGLSDADIALAYIEQPEATMKFYMSYGLLIKPGFDELYARFVSQQPPEDGLAQSRDEPVALRPDSYDKHKRVLFLSETLFVAIARRGKAKKSRPSRHFECFVLEKLFNSKTSMSGVSFHILLGISKGKTLSKTELKKVRNTRTAINKKVTEAGGPQKLIVTRGETAFVNPGYLSAD